MRHLGLLTAALLLATAGPANAQFNPHGRTKKGKPAPAATPQRPAAQRPTPSAPKAPSATKPPATETAPAPATKGSAERDGLILRYTGAALAQPGAEFPI